MSQLKKQGYITMSPAVLASNGGFEHSDYMHVCFAMIDVCDAVYMQKDWRDSKGARMELQYARKFKKKFSMRMKARAEIQDKDRKKETAWQERAAANPRKKNAASGTFVPTFRRESLPRRRQNFLLFRAMKNMAARTAPTEHRKKRSCKEWRNAKFAEKPQALFP